MKKELFPDQGYSLLAAPLEKKELFPDQGWSLLAAPLKERELFPYLDEEGVVP